MPSLSEASVKLPPQSAITFNARSLILSSTLRLLGVDYVLPCFQLS